MLFLYEDEDIEHEPGTPHNIHKEKGAQSLVSQLPDLTWSQNLYQGYLIVYEEKSTSNDIPSSRYSMKRNLDKEYSLRNVSAVQFADQQFLLTMGKIKKRHQ